MPVSAVNAAGGTSMKPCSRRSESGVQPDVTGAAEERDDEIEAGPSRIQSRELRVYRAAFSKTSFEEFGSSV
jgi:hypothetical protein